MVDRHACSRRSILLIVFLVILTFQLLGCAAGYYSYKTTDQSITQPTVNLSDVKIFYIATSEANTIERILRERFLIADIKKIGNTNIQKDSDRIVISFKLHYEDYPWTSQLWGIVSAVSLATIPAIVDRDATVTFEVIAPNGDEKKCQYRFTERFYSWLPFMFLAPDFWYIFLDGKDDHQQKKVTMLDQITTRFVVDATPFIVSHSTFSVVL